MGPHIIKKIDRIICGYMKKLSYYCTKMIVQKFWYIVLIEMMKFMDMMDIKNLCEILSTPT